MDVFELYESNVRSYCRSFPTIFNRAKDCIVYSESEERYIDFLAGAGALNYGHNNDEIKNTLIEYIQADGITHGLDMYTSAKKKFIRAFSEKVLEPRNLNYKIQFPGPTGTNAVEAALKLARKVKKRTGIFSFMGGFHGMTTGSLALTGNKSHRNGLGAPLQNVTFMPYPFGFMKSFDSIEYIDNVLTDPNSGIDKPAAMILETVQAEGGVVVAPVDWLQRLRQLCDKHDILMICDEIQVGSHRTGPYFSFERAEIVPDIVTLSKSLGGYGLAISSVLFKPELDIWLPGEHNGTFRGNQLAFVAAVGALKYIEKYNIEKQIEERENIIREFLENEIASLHPAIEIRGLGMIWGIDFNNVGEKYLLNKITEETFKRNLIIENAGRNGNVLKLLPPLNIDIDSLKSGLEIIKESVENCLSRYLKDILSPKTFQLHQLTV